MFGRGRCIREPLLILAVLLVARPARAEVLHMEPNYEKTELTATVAEPFGVMRDHPTATGSFQLIKGDIEGDPQNPAATGHVKLVINATTYDSGNNTRDNAVIGTALETTKYQVIIFDSTGIEDIQIDAPGVSGSATVVGNLTLHGTTRVMRVPVRVALSTDGQFTADGQVTFRYTDFGIKRPRYLFVAPAGDEVTIAFRVVAQRPGPPAATTQSRRGAPSGPATADQLAAGRPVR